VLFVRVAARYERATGRHEVDQGSAGRADLARTERIAKDPRMAQAHAPGYIVWQTVNALAHCHAAEMARRLARRASLVLTST
jgi:hypothetical protein